MKKETLQKFTGNIIFLSLCCISFYFLLLRPLPRQIGMIFRNTLYIMPIILLTALAAFTLRSRILSSAIKALLFAFLIAPYSGLLNSGASDQYALGGVIPWSDAFTLQLNTQRFLYGKVMGQTTAIRPISSVFYAVFLKLTDNNYFALQLFLCASIALCILLAANSVKDLYGPVTASIFICCLFFYVRQRYGTFMTEPYGILCGLLCCALFLDALRKNSPIRMFPAFIMLSLGLNARPAALFLFPVLGLWYFFVFTKEHRKRYILSATAFFLMLSGFWINSYTQDIVFGSHDIPNRQAAEMIYGLCRGGESWGDVVFSNELASIDGSEHYLKDLAGLCLPLLKEHPENILTSLKRIYWDSLIRSEYYGAFSFINGNPSKAESPVRFAWMGVWLLGFIGLIFVRKDIKGSFLLCAAISVMLSMLAAVPFSSNYLRLYAFSIWIPAIICGLYPQKLFGKWFSIETSVLTDHTPITLGISGLILFLSAFGPFWIHAFPMNVPTVQEYNCGPNETVLVTSIDPGSYIYLNEQNDLPYEHIPYFRLPYARQHFHDTASLEMFEFTDAIEAPTAIIRGMDLLTGEDALIFAPLEMAEGIEGNVQFCGNFIDPPILRNDRFFIPNSIFSLE